MCPCPSLLPRSLLPSLFDTWPGRPFTNTIGTPLTSCPPAPLARPTSPASTPPSPVAFPPPSPPLTPTYRPLTSCHHKSKVCHQGAATHEFESGGQRANGQHFADGKQLTSFCCFCGHVCNTSHKSFWFSARDRRERGLGNKQA